MSGVKLSTKLTLLVGALATLITVLACLAISSIIFTLTEKQIKTQLIDQSFQIVRDYLEVNSGKLELKNRDDGQTLVMALRNFDLSVYIVDVNNLEIGSYGIYRNLDQAEKLTLLPREIIAKIIDSKTGVYRDTSLSLNGRYDTFSLPLLNKDTPIGYLQVARQNNVLILIRNAIVTAIIILIPLVWLTAIGTGLWSANLILKPLYYLVGYFQHLDVNNLPRQIILPGKIDSEIKILGETFNILIQRINSVLTRQKQIAENISHEFKTPLARISSSLEVLESELPPSLQSQIKRIGLETIELGKQVDTLLDLALYEGGQAKMVTPYFITPLVQALILKVPSWLYVSLKIPPAMKVAVPIGHMRVILQNIIANAVQHNFTHGNIFIKGKSEVNGWSLIIENTAGQVRNLHRVFDRKYKAASPKGYGLGLSIVKDICRKQGLKISFDLTEKNRIRVILAYEKH